MNRINKKIHTAARNIQI